MFSAAIPSPPSPFVRRFAGRKLAIPKFPRALVKMSARESMPMSAHPLAKSFSQSFVSMFAPTSLKRSAQSFVLTAGRPFQRSQEFPSAARHRAFSFNRCNLWLRRNPPKPSRQSQRSVQCNRPHLPCRCNLLRPPGQFGRHNRNSQFLLPRWLCNAPSASGPAILSGNWRSKTWAAVIAGTRSWPPTPISPTPISFARALN